MSTEERPESAWSYSVRNPLQILALIIGASAAAADAGMARHGNYAVALAFGALGAVILLGSGLMMLRSNS